MSRDPFFDGTTCRCNPYRASGTYASYHEVYRAARNLVRDAWEWLPSSMLRDRDCDETVMLAAAEAVYHCASTIEQAIARKRESKATYYIKALVHDYGALILDLEVRRNGHTFSGRFNYVLPGSPENFNCELRIDNGTHFTPFTMRARDVQDIRETGVPEVVDSRYPRVLVRATCKTAFNVIKKTDMWKQLIGDVQTPEASEDSAEISAEAPPSE